MPLSQEDIDSILKKAILAPSGDNCQPWKFRVDQEGVDLFIAPSPVPTLFDSGCRNLYISAGAVIENMRVAATEFGYGVKVNYFPHPGDEKWVARIKFEATSCGKHPHLQAIDRRCTNRKFYDSRRKIEPAIYEKLAQIPSGFRLLWIKKGSADYKKLARLIGQADQIRFENERLHREFFKLIRFRRREEKAPQEGLDIHTFEISPLEISLFRFISEWKRLLLLKAVGFTRSFADYAERQMQSSQAAGLMAAPSHRPEDYVRGGEMMQRVWHEITLEGLSLQPMEGIPVFLIHLLFDDRRQSFSPKQRQLLEKIKQEFLPLFGINEQNGPIFLFRMGYSAGPSARSLRRPVESFIIRETN